MDNNFTLLGLGEVEYVEGGSFSFDDDANAGRIKVRVDSDGNKTTEELAYAFPLLPKSLHVLPQVGEGVIVLVSKIGNFESQRYYVGPIISQPQFNTRCTYEKGRGDAVSLLQDKKAPAKSPLEALSRAGESVKGSFPNPNDVALIGRGREDVICRYRDSDKVSEVNIRAGIRLEPSDIDVKFIKGNVVFNHVDPAYIQVKHKVGGVCGLKETPYDNDPNSYESPEVREGNSVVNVVADKFNFISNKAHFGESVTDPEQGVKEEDIDYVMSQLHRGVYGDELIVLLKLIVKALFQHTHPFSMLQPTVGGTPLEDLTDYPYEKILSQHFRIS